MSAVPLPKLAPAEFRAGVPSLLAATDAWIGHRSKRPVLLPDGQRSARTNAPSTWRSFDAALEFYERTIADPAAGVGFVLQRATGVVFLDFDHCLDAGGAAKPWAAPLLAPFLGRTFVERSLSGAGLHAMVLGDVERARPGLVPPGAAGDEHVEVYNDRRFVAVTGAPFDGAPILLAPMQAEVDALLASLGAGARAGEGSPPADDLSPAQLAERTEEARSALAVLDPDAPYPDWIAVGMALHHGLGAAGLALWDEWSARGGKYREGEPAERWASFRRSGVTLGTLFHAAKEAGWRSPLDDPRRQFEPIPDEPAPANAPFPAGGFRDWVDGGYQLWRPNPKQEIAVPCFSEANLRLFFAHHADWGDRLRYNIRSQLPEVGGAVVDDDACLRAQSQSHAWLGWSKRTFGRRTVQEIIQIAAERRPFDPVAEWLRSLEWDGERRVDSLAATMGVEDTPLTRRCLTRWLIGAAARALRPGCRMQNMLLLIGPQGRYKSGLLERLASRPEWFHESHIELRNKEGYVTLDRKWIVEFAELDGIRKADVERVKAFISESVSNYRAPYAREAADHPRHFVMAGTANEDHVLRDPTGARRFWPIRCPGKLDVQVLEPALVAQVWAEVRSMYEGGVRWWDEGDEVAEVTGRNEEFYAESSADLMIAKVVEEEFASRGALRMKQLVSRLHEQRIIQPGTPGSVVAAVLRRHGWASQTLRIDDEVSRFWFPPTTPDADRKRAAVIVMEEWRRSVGRFGPGEERAGS